MSLSFRELRADNDVHFKKELAERNHVQTTPRFSRVYIETCYYTEGRQQKDLIESIEHARQIWDFIMFFRE